jgi:uncharacterized repeat protein (TIGR01451 family)
LKAPLGTTILITLILLGLALPGTPAGAQTSPGSSIVNTAQITYAAGDQTGLTSASNTVSITVVTPRTASSLDFLRAGSASRESSAIPVAVTYYSASGLPSGPFLPLDPPVQMASAPIDLTQPVYLSSETVFHQGEPLFIRVDDPDQNLDYNSVDNVLVEIVNEVNGDRELLRLAETGPATGRFAGYIQTISDPAPQAKNGILSVQDSGTVGAYYTDPYDGSDLAEAAALIDPVGILFDSRTGLPVDGARITLIDNATGQPASVLGDDGTSLFPATVLCGGSVTDSGGNNYEFPAGGYRFPWIEPGEYRLEIESPPGYLAPSRETLATLQGLPGGPFFLSATASFGEPFFVIDGPPLHIDLPLDPLDTNLFVAKSAGKTSVSVGDFLEYAVSLDNRGQDDASDLEIVDILPPGFRYRAGSSRLDGEAIDDPTVSADGATLTYRPAALAAGDQLEIRYVTEVITGARTGDAINLAFARWARVRSNEARATVRVLADLFGETCTIVGRVEARPCEGDSLGSIEDPAGVPGVRVTLETGAFAITDSEGRYHLAQIAPGAHVVQMDLASLPQKYEAGSCEVQDRRAEHPYARLVDLQGGTLWRTDFGVHLRPPRAGGVEVDLATTLEKDAIASEVQLKGNGVPLRNLRLTVLLPDSTSYVPGSSRLDGRNCPEPDNRGGVLIYRLGDVPEEWTQSLTLGARVNSTSSRSNLVLQAVLVFDSPMAKNQRTPVAENVVNLVPESRRIEQPELVLHPHFPSLSAELDSLDKARIDTLAAQLASLEVTAIKVVGHSDNQRIRPGAHPLYHDNQELSLARAQTVGGYLADALGLPDSRLTIYGLGPTEPIAANSTAEGRALNRRVTLQVWSERTIHLLPEEAVRDHHRQKLELTGLRPGETWKQLVAAPEKRAAAPSFDSAWLERSAPGREILWPPAEFLPPLPTLKFAVKHDPTDRVVLRLNGIAIGPLNFGGTDANQAGTVAVSRWTGLDLEEGDNLLQVQYFNADGQLASQQRRTVHYSGPPMYAELVPELSTLTADGRSTPVVAVRLTDSQGHPAREGVVGQFSVAEPYAPLLDKNDAERQSLSGFQEKRTTYFVGPAGVALIRLEPTTLSGEGVLTLPLLKRDEELRFWLQPQDRDWILVGLAEGTAGYSAVSGNLEALASAGQEEHFYQDNRLAFFAKGRLKGTWLATVAYDSRKQGGRPEANLFEVVDPNSYYTVYGDGVTQGHEAASTEKLYIKLERNRFYALFGDFTTGLTVTELSRYNRSLTGVKSGMQKDDYGFTVFASRTHHAYVKDEIPGDGTSGLYRLSREQLVVHSEKITFQVRDRFRSEMILSERTLTRFIDYEIDYAAGTLFFKEPVYSQDQDFNPRFIVADYETWDDSEAVSTGGGRGSVRPRGGPVEIGATAIHEGSAGPGGGDLAGLDLRWDLDRSTRLKAETSLSDRDEIGTRQAWFAELSRHTGTLQGRTYFRELETDFGLGQLNGGQVGTRKLGADLTWRLSKRMRADVLAYRLENLTSGTDRRVAETKWNWSGQRLRANLGLREAVDGRTEGDDLTSRQVTAGTSVQLFKNRVRLQAGREQSIGGHGDSEAFPTRSTLGAEYEAMRNQIVFLNQEWVNGRPGDTRCTRLGLKAVPWTGGQVITSREDRFTESGRRVFSNVGLKQSWRINEIWNLDGGLDHGRAEPLAAGLEDESAAAATSPGTEDFTALSVGATCRRKHWLWDQRVEWRNSTPEDKWGVHSGLFFEPSGSVGLLGSLRLLGTENRDGGHQKTSDIGLGLAWRPQESAWTLLEKLAFKTEDRRDAQFSVSNWRIVNNLNVSWLRSNWLQISALYGSRYARETIGGENYRSYTDLGGLETRFFFKRRWDASLRGSVKHSWNSGVAELGSGITCGYKLLEDVWLSLGYNFSGYRDRDLAAGEYTAHGPFMRFRIRFNQESTREMLR